ncbi:MAG TPA: hypothetical protein VMV31_08835 [Terriglobales bacterium]|nr:hypothetical protein [Terriglobales bacterium]
MRNGFAVALIFIVMGLAAQSRPGGGRHPVVSGLMPGYPPLALQAGVEGSVTFELSVEGGRVKQISGAAGNPLLVGPSKQVARSWQFGDATNADVPVEFRFTIGRSGQAGTARSTLEYLPSGGVRVDVLGYRPPPVVLHERLRGFPPGEG